MTSINVSKSVVYVEVTNANSTTVVKAPVSPVVVDVVTVGPQGPSSASTTYAQPTASSTWTINHNLGYRPHIDLYDLNFELFEGQITHTSVNTSVIVLTIPTAGYARLL
jgi:hypothetical protein